MRLNKEDFEDAEVTVVEKAEVPPVDLKNIKLVFPCLLEQKLENGSNIIIATKRNNRGGFCGSLVGYAGDENKMGKYSNNWSADFVYYLGELTLKNLPGS